MKAPVGAAIAAWIGCAGLAVAAPAAVHRDFAAAFPSAPVVQTDGPVHRYVDDEMNVIFEVDVITGGPGAETGPQADLRRLEAFGRRDRGTLQSHRPATLSGRPATEAVFADASGAEATVRTAGRDGRGYLVIYRHARDQGSETERDGFLNSFRFVR